MANDKWFGFGITALVAIASACLAFPWLPDERSNPLPAVFALDSASGDLLLASLNAVDAACALGDVQAFARTVSAEYRAQRQKQLGVVGRRLDGAALQEAVAHRGGLASECRRLEFARGRSRGNRACLVFAFGDSGSDGGYPMREGFKALTFTWDGHRFFLEAVREVPGPVDDAGADALIAQLLAGR